MKRYWLKFSVTQTEAPLDVISVTHGGSLSNAAARHEVDFAVTGSRHSKYGVLSDHVPSEVQIEFPAGQITMTPGVLDSVSIPDDAMLLSMSTRLGSSINGTIVSTVAGQAATPLSHIFTQRHGVTSIPLIYSHWQSHSCSLSIADAHIIGPDGLVKNVRLTPRSGEVQAVLDSAEKLVAEFSPQSWSLRQKELIFHQAPGLTKVVGVVPLGTGINGSGMELMANLVDT